MRWPLLSLFLVGCPWWSPPEVTSASGMAGVVLRPDGKAVVGLKVESVESSEITDDAGRFGLYFKPPDTHVHFVHEQAWYRRSYRPVDEGHVVEIMLPPTRALQVDCGPFECALQLHWDLADGLTARRSGRCKAGGTTILKGAPQGVPEVSCRPKVTEPEVELSTRFDDDRLSLLPPSRAVMLTVTGDDAEGCTVFANGREIPRGDEGFEVSLGGEVRAYAVCGGRASVPVIVPGGETAGEIAWSAAGPSLRPPPGMELDRLKIANDTWSLTIRASRSGAFLLPPLPAGEYAVQLFTNAEAPPVPRPADLQPGRLQGQMLPTGQYAGFLKLDNDVSDGVIDAETP